MVTTGTLPPGLSLAPTGALSGTPSQNTAPLDASLIPRGIEHLRVIGQHALPPELAPQTVMPEYTLTHLPPSRVVIHLPRGSGGP